MIPEMTRKKLFPPTRNLDTRNAHDFVWDFMKQLNDEQLKQLIEITRKSIVSERIPKKNQTRTTQKRS